MTEHHEPHVIYLQPVCRLPAPDLQRCDQWDSAWPGDVRKFSLDIWTSCSKCGATSPRYERCEKTA
jgi:hypothetical protein